MSTGYVCLGKEFVQLVVAGLGDELRGLLVEYPAKLYVAGGFVRDRITAMEPNDVDLFALGDFVLFQAQASLLEKNEAIQISQTENSTTYLCWSDPDNRYSSVKVQFVKTVYGGPEEVIKGFDWSICQAAVWWSGDEWVGIASEEFVSDIATGRMHYNPENIHNPASAMLRMVRFARDYNVDYKDIAGTVGMMVAMLSPGVDPVTATELCQRVFERVRAGYGKVAA